MLHKLKVFFQNMGTHVTIGSNLLVEKLFLVGKKTKENIWISAEKIYLIFTNLDF